MAPGSTVRNVAIAGAVALVGGLILLAAIGATLLGGGPLGDGGAPTGATNGSTGDAATVEVVDIVDGDTMDVEYGNGTGERVRLLGVDTPEVHTAVSPDEYEGVPDSEPARRCLREQGHEASAFAERKLSGETVRIRFDEAADRRGSFGRLLVYVVDDGVSFNHRLLERGHARVFDGAFSESTRFYRAESAARETRTGVWSCRDAGETDGETPADSSEVVRTDPLRSSDGSRHAGGVVDTTRPGRHATDTLPIAR